MVKLISGWDFPSSHRGLSLRSGIWARHPRDTLQRLPWLTVLLTLLLKAGGEHTKGGTQIHLGFAAVQSLSCVRPFAPHGLQHQAPLSSTVSQNLLRFLSIDFVMLSCPLTPLSCLQSSPASESFPMSWYFASGGQNDGASASVVPMNILRVPVPNLPSTSWVTVDGSSPLSEPQKKGLAASSVVFHRARDSLLLNPWSRGFQ